LVHRWDLPLVLHPSMRHQAAMTPAASWPLVPWPFLVAVAVTFSATPCAAMVIRSWSSTDTSDAALPNPKSDTHGLRCMNVSWKDAPRLVTAIVSSSPRKEDASGLGLQVLQQTIASIRDILGLAQAQIIIALDALPEASSNLGTERLSDDVALSYEKKISALEDWNAKEFGGHLAFFRNTEWTHQTEMLHRVFDWLSDSGKLTPIVYLAQDDSPVAGEIDVPFILETLGCDPDVDYVRFLWSNDCTEGKASNWNEPCVQHGSTSLLHNVSRMSDRPHFATASFYWDTIFARTPRNYRGAPERSVRSAKHMWLYGERGNMLHDTNMLTNSYNDQPHPDHS